MADFEINLKMVDIKNISIILSDRGLQNSGPVQRFIDSEVLRLCTPYVPWDRGTLNASGTSSTNIGSGEVRYSTPYARRWYYEPANFQGAPKRGNYWFERMKREGGRTQILQGAAQIAGGHI